MRRHSNTEKIITRTLLTIVFQYYFNLYDLVSFDNFECVRQFTSFIFSCNVFTYVSWQRCRCHIIFFPTSLSINCDAYVARFALRIFENKKTFKKTLGRLNIDNLSIACLFEKLRSPPHFGQNLRTRTRTRNERDKEEKTVKKKKGTLLIRSTT